MMPPKVDFRAMLFLLCLMFLVVPAWADTIDQSFVAPPSSALTLSSPFAFAQMFTAGGTGTLTQVSFLWQVQGGSAQLQITSALGGVPTGPALSSVTVAAGSYTLSQFIMLTTTVPITAGTQYGIVVTPAAGTTVNLWGDENSVYLGGGVLLTSDQGISWMPLPFPSLSFQTAGIPAQGSSGWGGGAVPPATPPGSPDEYPFQITEAPVLPNSEVPEPGTIVLLATGLAGLCAKLRK